MLRKRRYNQIDYATKIRMKNSNKHSKIALTRTNVRDILFIVKDNEERLVHHTNGGGTPLIRQVFIHTHKFMPERLEFERAELFAEPLITYILHSFSKIVK